MAQAPLFFLDHFALRQFSQTFKGARVNFDPAAFTQKINDLCKSESELQPGYAPFCKHVFVPNFTDCRVTAFPITPENVHLLKSGYQARTSKELAVLNRWFPASKLPNVPAKYLDIILYSREQIILEREAMQDSAPVPAEPWGIISIKPQDEAHETPMQPITMMRNALGREEGGSGVPLDRAKYAQSVEYWSTRGELQDE